MERDPVHHGTRLRPFDPSAHGGDLAQAFDRFLRLYECKYIASDRKAPTGTADTEAWMAKDKWVQLMGNYATDRFLDDIAAVHQSPSGQTFAEMTGLLKTRYAPTRNVTISHFDFHRLRQKPGQLFDDFVNEVKNAAKKCAFKCETNTCTVADTLIRDQVIIGANSEEFRKNALKSEWKLVDIEKEGRRTEAVTTGVETLREAEGIKVKVERVRPKKYSRK